MTDNDRPVHPEPLQGSGEVAPSVVDDSPWPEITWPELAWPEVEDTRHWFWSDDTESELVGVDDVASPPAPLDAPDETTAAAADLNSREPAATGEQSDVSAGPLEHEDEASAAISPASPVPADSEFSAADLVERHFPLSAGRAAAARPEPPARSAEPEAPTATGRTIPSAPRRPAAPASPRTTASPRPVVSPPSAVSSQPAPRPSPTRHSLARPIPSVAALAGPATFRNHAGSFDSVATQQEEASAAEPATPEASPEPATTSAQPQPAPRHALPAAPEAPFSLPSAPYAQYEDTDTRTAATAKTHPRPSPTARRPRRRTGQWLLIAGIAAVAALALLVVLGAQGRLTPLLGVGQSAGPSGTAQQAVKDYLQALADGDATTALSFAKQAPADHTMLTDAALATANAKAPITDVSVTTQVSTDYRSEVTAEFLQGTEKVTRSFTVYPVGTQWKLYDVSQSVNLSHLVLGDVPVTLNGVLVTAGQVELFPGSYEFTSIDSRYRFEHGSFVLHSPSDHPDLSKVKLTLSDSGVKLMVAAARKKLDSCLASSKLQPKNCGFAAATAGVSLKPGTLQWQATDPEAIEAITPALDSDNPRIASADVKIPVSAHAFDRKRGRWVDAKGSVITKVLAAIGTDTMVITLA